jgi:hypothetical protein
MGQEIPRIGFSEQDQQRFVEHLARETAQLESLALQGGLSDARFQAGYELEAWLLDHAGFPSPVNEEFLRRLDDPLVVPELSRFNVELNAPPLVMGAGVLRGMETSLAGTWQRCQEVAHGMDTVLAMVGILPNLRLADLGLDHMSAVNRFVALNREVQRQRGGQPIHIRIEGEESLELLRPDVMLEAATTSFQVHLQVPHVHVARHYNAALVCCGPLLAASVNSPLLFGRRLWQETRIPLFEQSVEVGGYAGLADASVRRVTLGQGYVGGEVLALFRQNLDLYPVLLPIPQEGPAERYPHLRLHNGTIWRWVRPLVGFAEGAGCHVRLEQRVLPSGPSVPDMVANAAFYLGLCHALATGPEPPETRLGFAATRANFYAAARHGLEAELRWLDGHLHPARTLILDVCLPLAEQGLAAFGLEANEFGPHLEVLRQRVRSGQTGAVWQLRNLAREQGDAGRMMANYLENQRAGLPVHEWEP